MCLKKLELELKTGAFGTSRKAGILNQGGQEHRPSSRLDMMPSTRSQDKKHWAMNFRFPIPVWGHPVVVEQMEKMDDEGDWITREKKLVWSYRKKYMGRKNMGWIVHSPVTLFIEINGRLHWGKTILVDYRDLSKRNGTSQWRVLFFVSHRCWCISPTWRRFSQRLPPQVVW